MHTFSNAISAKRSLVSEIAIAAVASVFLGLGTFFLLLNSGVYV